MPDVTWEEVARAARRAEEDIELISEGGTIPTDAQIETGHRLLMLARYALLAAEAEPVHWYIQPNNSVPSPFCVIHKNDADAAEWHEKEHGHKVTPLFLRPSLSESRLK